MFKFGFLLFVTAFAAATAQARSLLEHPHFEMEPGRKIFVEMQRSAENKPTLLFLPGHWCAPLMKEKFIQILKDAGLGVAVMNFSMQAPSIDLLAKDVQPLFKKRDMTLQDLADEIEFVAKMVRAEFPGIQLIPVSLSYSAIVTPLLKSFPHIIETSPMTSTWASIPSIRDMRSMLNFNPFLSREAVRKILDQTYFTASWSITDFTIKHYDLPSDRKYEMNEGYEALMRMAEDFDWKTAEIDTFIRRDWILASNEEPVLKIHQRETLERFRQLQPSTQIIEIKGARHAIKNYQPEKFAEALIQLSSGCAKHVTL